MSVRIGPHLVGAGQPAFIIAEVGQAHDGSLGTAHAFIDIAADAGADAIKFQTHIAEAESTPDEPFRVNFSYQDNTRYEYWKRMEFSAEHWAGLAAHAAERGISFLSSAFSVEAVELLEKLGMAAWKVGSGETTNTVLLDAMLQTGKPILLSTGMSTTQEIGAMVDYITAAGNDVVLYQCTSKYPSPPEEVGLPLIPRLRELFGVPVGLSDHSGSTSFGIAAAALGAASVEVHITLSEFAFGPDVPSSLTPPELRRMVTGIRQVEASMLAGLDKDCMADDLTEMRRIFGKSVVARTELQAGTLLSQEHLTVKKPAGGIAPADIGKLLGKTLRRNFEANEKILWEDLQ